MKKLLMIITLLVGLLVAGVFTYRFASPEIVIVNAAPVAIEKATIQLPSNRVVFGEVPPGAKSTIYYSASQADGTYNYSVSFPGEPVLSGSCGYVTNSDYGKRFQLVVRGSETVECLESNKIF